MTIRSNTDLVVVSGRPQLVLELQEELAQLHELSAQAPREHGEHVVMAAELVLHLGVDHGDGKVDDLDGEKRRERLLPNPGDPPCNQTCVRVCVCVCVARNAKDGRRERGKQDKRYQRLETDRRKPTRQRQEVKKDKRMRDAVNRRYRYLSE